MSDKTTRVVASVSLAVALLSLVLAAVALSRASESEAQMRELSESLTRALGSRSGAGEHGGAPPPGLDTEE